jgi:hypothetical protein
LSLVVLLLAGFLSGCTPASETPTLAGPRGETTRSSGGPEFGAQFHCVWSFYDNPDRVAVLDRLAAAGIDWVRIDVGWDGIESPTKGARAAWYLDIVDFCVNEANRRGLKVLVLLWLTPEWARNAGTTDRHPPSNPDDYADFLRWAAGYFAGRVQAWEIWNEPDPHQQFWLGTTPDYAALLKAAYPAAKEGNPEAAVVLGGPSSNDDVWIRELYSLGVKGSFDVLSTHPYQGKADEPPEKPDDGNRWWFSHLPAVRQVMLDYGDPKPIWFTEFGWSAHANDSATPPWALGVTPEQQADYAVRAYEFTRRSYPYVTAMFWYKERSDPTGTDVHQEGFGLLDERAAPRPVYGAPASRMR